MINNTQYLTGGKSPNPLSPPTNLAAKAGNAQVTLTWTDPPNATSEPSGQTIATWAYTQIVRKEGSQPTGPNDGTLVVKSSVRDQYQTTGYIDTNLTNDTTYYYGAFAYNSDGVYSEGAFVSATPQAGTPIGELAEGTIITINESGAPVQFYVSQHGYQNTLNTNRTLVTRIQSARLYIWDENGMQSYSTSTADAWLNSTYKALFSEKVQTMMGETTFPCCVGNGNYRIKNISRSVFFLSMKELNRDSSSQTNEGSPVPIWNTLISPGFTQWTRTNDTKGGIYYVLNGGTYGYQRTDENSYNYRPNFTLPSTALVDSNNALIET